MVLAALKSDFLKIYAKKKINLKNFQKQPKINYRIHNSRKQ